MDDYLTILFFVASFGMVALASKQIAEYFSKIKLPLISGFIFTGVIAGPYVLKLINVEVITQVHFVDELSLGFIAFAAGSELFLKEYKDHFRSIRIITTSLALGAFIICSTAVYLIADYIPFMSDMPNPSRLAIALLAGAILVARSPASAIAIIKEMRAKGRFTRTVIGVTVVIDVLVIMIFAITSTIADAIFTQLNFDYSFVLLLLGEFAISIVLGVVIGKILQGVLSLRVPDKIKTAFVLLTGYLVFLFSEYLREISDQYLSFEVLLEPLLLCMIGSFFVVNFTNRRNELSKVLQQAGPTVYIIFFTLAGASMELDVLAGVWHIALALFFVRIFSLFVGTFTGGVIAGERMRHNRLAWMGYITQAGVGLGLAKEVAVEFPDWGREFSSIIMAIIILNQLVGPLLFKWVLVLVKESHLRDKFGSESKRSAIIFGQDARAITLDIQLRSHFWNVKVISTELRDSVRAASHGTELIPVDDFSLKTLKEVGCNSAGTIVTILPDDDSYNICELAYENFPKTKLVVDLDERDISRRFEELGALTVIESTAIVSLLDHFVRSPAGSSLLLGMTSNKDIIDIEVTNPDLYGTLLSDLKLPLDILILSIQRAGETVFVHGNIRFEKGDKITVVGTNEGLKEVSLKFSS
ncbi:K+ transport systems, NAD-binding component [Candidatus Scalindua japonica]|uniref:K+ transport systems, NAD-binding component n=1 Tax=Candidatus Scalindua japonica TaxID=1284222 RepID=A0A286U1J7_9BACT|nr:cation:proton antiporter [Candidatus Scalindua japonica]GAX61941.1 K+ transport systems, NAD-binding component [Candidatus Scalindua japonica]